MISDETETIIDTGSVDGIPAVTPEQWHAQDRRKWDSCVNHIQQMCGERSYKHREQQATGAKRPATGWARHVICVETGREFDGCEQAGRFVGVTDGAVRSSANGGTASGHDENGFGYHWRWAGCAARLQKNTSKRKPVKCRERQELRFGSIRQCADACGVSEKVMSYCLDTDGCLRSGRSQYVGMHFYKVNG